MAENPYLYEVGPDLVHGTHLNIPQVFVEHDHLFHTTPSVEYLSFKIVEIQLKLLLPLGWHGSRRAWGHAG